MVLFVVAAHVTAFILKAMLLESSIVEITSNFVAVRTVGTQHHKLAANSIQQSFLSDMGKMVSLMSPDSL